MTSEAVRARSNSVSPHYDESEASLTTSGHARQSNVASTMEEDDDADFKGRTRDGNPPPYSYSEASSHSMELEDMSDTVHTDDEETGLTQSQRGKRRKRKPAAMDPESRADGVPTLSQESKKTADMAVIKSSAVNVLLIGLWYIFSLTISIYNKWMFDPGHLDFHFPLFTTCMHMVVQFSLASSVLFFFPRFRPKAPEVLPEDNVYGTKRPVMTKTFYLTRIGPCGSATGLDIGLGNRSLQYISLTFFTMCKSSSLAFVLLFAFIFQLERPSVKLVLIIATMTGGVVMMVFGEAAFEARGFILVILSSFFSGFRWALTQILLLRNPATSNPFSSIFFLAPVMFVTLLVIAIPVEGFPALGEGLANLVEKKGTVQGILLLLFPGVLAFCMTSSEFALLKRTSVVTLSICGIFKEVVTISAAEIVYHDPLTTINISGLIVTIASIAAYNYIKIKKMRKDARDKAQGDTISDRDEAFGEEREAMLAAEEQEVRDGPRAR